MHSSILLFKTQLLEKKQTKADGYLEGLYSIKWKRNKHRDKLNPRGVLYLLQASVVNEQR